MYCVWRHDVLMYIHCTLYYHKFTFTNNWIGVNDAGIQLEERAVVTVQKL